ncbi:MAG: hypothetical protein AABM31_00990 [Actinomycetota bacterium]
MRETLAYRRAFLSRRTAAFDAAVASAAAAMATRSLVPLVATLPYAAISLRRAARFGSVAPKIVAVDLAADTVGLASLVRGSVAVCSPLL